MFATLLLATLVCTAPAVSEAQTLRYQVRSAGLPAEELGRMLEQLYLDLAHFLGAAPRGRQELELYADLARYQEALHDDHEPFLGGGGYYAIARRKAYLYVQPSEYYTRQLVLHEATHQFHLQTVESRMHSGCGWYKEGLAEYFGMHTWDGKTLRTGTVPAISLEDYPAQALRQFDELAPELEALIAGDKAAERPLDWALVHFIINRYPRQFAALRRQLHRGAAPAAAWRQCFGPLTPQFKSELRQWIVDHQQPWKSVWNAWQDRGNALEGQSATTGLAVLKNTPPRLTAEMDLLRGPLRAGLVFGYRSPDDFFVIQMCPDQKARIVRRADGRWQGLESYPAPPAPGGRNTLSVACSADGVILTVNGLEITRLPSQGQVGLNVDNCTVRFRIATAPQSTRTP